VRRSADGVSWGEARVVAAEPGTTCGNPAPVVDRETGTVWLLFCKDAADTTMARLRSGASARTVWETHSADGGHTWSSPAELTAQVKAPAWSWYATGPGHGIQLRSGRPVVPCDHRAPQGGDTGGRRHSHLLYSDDHGATWRLGGVRARRAGHRPRRQPAAGDAQLPH
jgi:sialidase-1